MSWGAIALARIGSNQGAMLSAGFNDSHGHDIALPYQGLFNRAPDAAGLAFRQAAMDRGVTLEQVATGFVESVEMVGQQRGALDSDFQV